MADDDDWTGTPPEGHHTRDQAKPDYWRGQRPLMLGGGILMVLVLVLLVVLLVR